MKVWELMRDLAKAPAGAEVMVHGRGFLTGQLLKTEEIDESMFGVILHQLQWADETGGIHDIDEFVEGHLGWEKLEEKVQENYPSSTENRDHDKT